MRSSIKKLLCLSIVVLMTTLFTSLTFAYGGYGMPVYDYQSSYFTWMVLDDIPRWVGANCSSNFTQYGMIAGQYIGFHDAYLFAKADPTSQFDTYNVWGGYSVRYYKGSTGLGSTSLSTCSDPVLADPNWIWFYKYSNANGLLGVGSGTYYAKTSATFSVDGAIGTRTLNNSVSFTIN